MACLLTVSQCTLYANNKRKARRYSQIAKGKKGTEPDTQTLFSIRLYCYGTLGTTREWLLKDNITPADVIARMMSAFMPEHLRALFFD